MNQHGIGKPAGAKPGASRRNTGLAEAVRGPTPRTLDVRARQALVSARRVFDIEAAAVAALSKRLDASFARAVEVILLCSGRTVVSGIGKSGHIATKIASTLASTGTPAFFVHPAEASHGDLGMITELTELNC